MRDILISRGVKGDALLDALDIVNDIRDIGGIVTNDGYAILYHRTDLESSKKIVESQTMKAKEDSIYASTRYDKAIVGYGDVVVQLKIKVELLILDDDFGDELHFRIKCNNKPIKVNAIIIKE